MTKANRRPTRGRKTKPPTTKTSTPNPLTDPRHLRIHILDALEFWQQVESALETADPEGDRLGDLRSALHEVCVGFENAAYYAEEAE